MPRRKTRRPKGLGSIRYRADKGIYEAGIVLSYKPNGQPGQRRRRHFNSSEAAETWLAEMRPLVKNFRAKSVLQKTIPELVEDFLAFKRVTLDEKTIDDYQGVLGLHVTPYFEKTKLQDLNDDLLKKWIIELSNQGRTQGVIHRAKRYFSIILNDAERSVPTFRNPLRYIEVPKPRRKRSPRWSKEEVTTVLEHCRKTSHVLHPYIHVAITTGMRREELLGLRWQDVDKKNSCLEIIQVTTYSSGHPITKLKTKTEDSDRTVFIDNETMTMLEQQRKYVNTLRKAKDWGEEDRVFPSIVGSAVSDTWLRDTFYALCNAAKVTPIMLRDLRSTYVSLSDGKVPDKVAAERTGHSETMRRETYLRTLRAEHKAAALSLEELLK
jgi:integrase